MVSCAVKWCGKSAKTSNFQTDGITFHRFPKCPERKEMWIDATSRGDKWFPTKYSVICSRHFTEDNFHVMKNRRRLLDSAVPSLYLPVLAPAPTIDASTDIEDKNSEISVAGTSSKKEVPAPTIDASADIAAKIEITVAGSSYKVEIVDSPLKDEKNPSSPKNESDCLDTPAKQSRKCSPLPDSPSAYNTLVNKRLCRRIIELTNAVKRKDKKIKKLGDSNRRLKRQIVSLKSLLAESENK